MSDFDLDVLDFTDDDVVEDVELDEAGLFRQGEVLALREAGLA